jgi:hypothetical protein
MLDIFVGHTCQGPIQIWAVLCQHVQNTWWITIDSLPSNLHSANFALVCAVGNRRCVVQIFNPSLPNPGKHGTLKTLANIPTFPFFIKYSALVRSENVETLYFRKIIEHNSSRSKLGNPLCHCAHAMNAPINLSYLYQIYDSYPSANIEMEYPGFP